MTKALGEVPEIEEVSPELEDIKKDPLNSVVGDITTTVGINTKRLMGVLVREEREMG